MQQLIKKLTPYINQIAESVIIIGHSVGYLIWYSLGLDKIVEALDNE